MTQANRVSLIETLNALPQERLEQLIVALDPPKGIIPPATAAHSDRTAALLHWAEDTHGCGLDRLQQALAKVINTQGTVSLSAGAKIPTPSRRTVGGALAHLNLHISAEDIDEARREMWGNFPRNLE
ncbi:MAG: hypothetical protein AB1489_39065 [Acidobacteriota bacterium]